MRTGFGRMAMVATAIMALSGKAGAADWDFSAATEIAASQASPGAANEALVTGQVFVSHTGRVRVLWDGVSVNGGSYSIGGTNNGEVVGAAALPNMQLDLQKIFGRKWMDSLKLDINSVAYDHSPMRGTTDLLIGKVMLNLSQAVVSTGSTQLRFSEGVGAGYFSREFHANGFEVNAIPAFLTFDSRLVTQVSPEVSFAIAAGAYANVLNHLSGGHNAVLGAYVSSEVGIGKQLALGLKLDGARMVQLSNPGPSPVATNVTAFVRYVLTQAQGQPKHALQLTVSATRDELMPTSDKSVFESAMVKFQYTVAF